MLIVRKEYYPNLIERIEQIRSSYPLKRFEIEYKFNKMMEELLEKAEFVSPGDLDSGREYGIPEFVPRATAFDKNRAMAQLRNHGDIYIAVWRWAPESKPPMFTADTAWGEMYSKPLSQVHAIVELPQED